MCPTAPGQVPGACERGTRTQAEQAARADLDLKSLGGPRDKVTASWRHYLGSTPASPYAAPARAADLSGLPSAYLATAEFDPNRDEAIGYGLRLLQAGVSVELHQWPGTFHGSQAILSAEISQRQIAELTAALRRGLAE